MMSFCYRESYPLLVETTQIKHFSILETNKDSFGAKKKGKAIYTMVLNISFIDTYRLYLIGFRGINTMYSL